MSTPDNTRDFGAVSPQGLPQEALVTRQDISGHQPTIGELTGSLPHEAHVPPPQLDRIEEKVDHLTHKVDHLIGELNALAGQIERLPSGITLVNAVGQILAKVNEL